MDRKRRPISGNLCAVDASRQHPGSHPTFGAVQRVHDSLSPPRGCVNAISAELLDNPRGQAGNQHAPNKLVIEEQVHGRSGFVVVERQGEKGLRKILVDC